MAEQNPLYAGIPNPILIRRELLMGTKDAIGLLKNYESVIVLREQKQAALMDLKRTTEEIIVLNRRFKNAMPKAPIKTASERAHKEKPIREDSPETETDKIDILEQELTKIEEELKGLQ
ncbi:hypothetical protein HY641_04635 [Candidatus Woesearchaeota archaeon]|nr:hypothetical protein [Candidatus Woesearchaeota archaeon]